MRFIPVLFLFLAAAASTQPTQWHTKGVITSCQAKLNHFERDQWINADADDNGLHIDLPHAGYSEVLFTDRFDYSEKAVMQINLAAINGSFSVQAVCYDSDGRIFNYVDLLEYLEKPGRFEVPLKIYRTPLKGTKRIAFKLWLAGDHPTATVSSLAYGTAE